MNYAILTENLTRTYKIHSGFYDPGTFYESFGGRFLYEIFMKYTRKKTLVYALNDVSLKVRRGEFVCLLGSNGSGKTTLIKILATLLPPSHGRAEIEGYDVIKERKEVVKRINYIPSLLAASAWVKPHLSVEQNFKIMSKLFGLPKEEILGFAEKLELTDVLSRPFGALSTGQQAKVGLTLGVLKKSPVYLLDEPTLGLSPEAVKVIRNYFVKINKELGITIFYATHHALEAQEMADRIIILGHGRIVADGDAETLIRNAGVEESIITEVYGAYFSLDQLLRELEPNYLKIEPVGLELGKCRIMLGVNDSDVVLQKLVKKLMSKGAKIKSLKVREANLEDAFMYYISGGRNA